MIYYYDVLPQELVNVSTSSKHEEFRERIYPNFPQKLDSAKKQDLLVSYS